MATLEFHGPFHIQHIGNLNLKGKKGIYIWGVMLETDKNGKMGNIIDFSKIKVPRFSNVKQKGLKSIKNGRSIQLAKFLPYYVGKHESDLEGRILEHHSIRVGDGLKKTRLKFDFYNDSNFAINFPIHIKNKTSQFIKNLKVFIHKYNIVDYFNNDDILNKIYNNAITLNGSTSKWPINKQSINNKPLNDSLKDIIYCNDNFWYCYAELPDEVNEDEVEYMEAQTFYSLKGKTISETLSYRVDGFGYTIIAEPTCEAIFKQDDNKNIYAAPNDFPGY